MARHIGKKAALFAPAGVVALTTLAANAAARSITAPGPRERKFVTPWELEIPHEEVGFRTEDGLILSGWWLPNPNAERTIVALHGHRGGRHHCVGVGAALYRRGANVLLFDHRGRGTSEGERVSLGYFETLDARAAVGYALSRAPGLPLGLIGYSMGAAVAIMIAARDGRVGAVVADSPFAAERELVQGLLKACIGPLATPVGALAGRLLPYDWNEVQPRQEVAEISPRAILLIHGLLDATCAPEDSRKLHAAAGDPKELWLLEDAGHCDAYFTDRAAYCERVANFFERHLESASRGATK